MKKVNQFQDNISSCNKLFYRFDKQSSLFGPVLFGLLLTLTLFSCSGKESFGIDNTPPEPVVMIPHLGDAGDPITINGEQINDSNNGIDTVPDNDWIRIQWQPVFDQDLNYLKVYRFGDYTAEAFVDSLPRNLVDRNEYLDTKLSQLNPIGETWFYYVKGYDLDGNFSVSDTVSYKLLQKPMLIAPDDFEQVSQNNITFQWLPTIDSIHYRVLVFDADQNYIWHREYYIDEDSGDILSMDYTGPSLSEHNMIVWRVDSFADVNNEGIAESGGESFERALYVDP
jgi:hypothetical protein